MTLSFLQLAIAGDLHGAWYKEDNQLLATLKPDGVIFVGDLSEGDLRIVKLIRELSIPTAVILGNHDRGSDHTGYLLQTQLNLLGELHCGWSLRDWNTPKLSVVGARPCSAGGGFHLSRAVQAVFGQMTMNESADRIVSAAKAAPIDWPLIVLAHSGPVGLGSQPDSPCGRDWKSPAIDWGDQDLALALHEIRKMRVPDLVIFGHMHHDLRRGLGTRRTIVEDQWGTVYLNAACVPRRGIDTCGESLAHLSWAEFRNDRLIRVAHRWFRSDASVAYEQTLFSRSQPKVSC